MHAILLQISVSSKSTSVPGHLSVMSHFFKNVLHFLLLKNATHFLNLSFVSKHTLLNLKNQYKTFQSSYL